MKIKVKECSLAEALSKKCEHKNPAKQSAFWRKVMYLASQGEMKKVSFTWKEDLRGVDSKTPCLYLMNHSSFTDLQIAATILKNKPYHIVCTNDGFVGKEKLMRGLGCIPTRKFITDLTLVKDMKYVADHLGESILMYPEASYSFDGSQTPLPGSLGKLIRMLGIPVMMIRTHGAFLRDPLYNGLQQRKVSVSATVSCLFTGEEVRSADPEQINAKLAESFTYDHFREQVQKGIRVTESFRADGLERALYKCPVCSSEGEMSGKGTVISCGHCGAAWTLSEEGKLCRNGVAATEQTPMAEAGEDSSFVYATDWYAWERECVRRELEAGEYELNTAVDIYVLTDLKSIYKVGEGNLVHSNQGFHLTGCEGELDVQISPRTSYSLYADFYWYEIGDMISIGDHRAQYYCFPKGGNIHVAKARLAAEELFALTKK